MTAPRYAPDQPLPPYSYVPGRFSHPISDPRGHRYGRHEQPLSATSDDWPSHANYRFGIDLFNHGYYWEAHEAWEALWHAVGHESLAGIFLKGLIKLAAAGVKAREGRAAGVARHAARAGELFREVVGRLPSDKRCGGLNIAELEKSARNIAAQAKALIDTSEEPVVVVLPVMLRPALS